MFEKDLKAIGLTEGESKVYEALLLLGSSTVGKIVKKSGVSYSKIYEVLERLISKGLASYVTKEKTKYFQAANPNRIKDYLEFQEAKIRQNKELFERLLPTIRDIQKLEAKMEDAEVFVGAKGLMTAYETLLEGAKKGDRGYFFYVYDPNYEDSFNFYSRTLSYFKKIGIEWLAIADKSYRDTDLAKRESSSIVKLRYPDFPVPGNIDIYKDRTLLITWKIKPIGVLINSKEVADNFRTYFEAVWKMSKR